MWNLVLAWLPKLKNFTYLGVIFSALSFYGTHLYYSEKISKLELEIAQNKTSQTENVLKSEREATAATRKVEEAMSYQAIATVEKYNEIKGRVENVSENLSIGDGSATVHANDWVFYHNAGVPVSGTTTTADRSNETDTRVREDTELEVILRNYQRCQVAVDRLKGWQDWYKELQDGR